MYWRFVVWASQRRAFEDAMLVFMGFALGAFVTLFVLAFFQGAEL